MNTERLPSGKFAVNAMLFQLALLAYNTLRFLGQQAIEVEELLPYKTGSLRKRLWKVIDDLVRIAVKVVRHAKRIYLKLWQKNPWVPCFQHLYGVCARL